MIHLLFDTHGFWFLLFWFSKQQNKQTSTHTPIIKQTRNTQQQKPTKQPNTKAKQGCHLFVAAESFCIAVKICIIVIQIYNLFAFVSMRWPVACFTLCPVPCIICSLFQGDPCHSQVFHSMTVASSSPSVSFELGCREGLQVFSCKCVKGKFFPESSFITKGLRFWPRLMKYMYKTVCFFHYSAICLLFLLLMSLVICLRAVLALDLMLSSVQYDTKCSSGLSPKIFSFLSKTDL